MLPIKCGDIPLLKAGIPPIVPKCAVRARVNTASSRSCLSHSPRQLPISDISGEFKEQTPIQGGASNPNSIRQASNAYFILNCRQVITLVHNNVCFECMVKERSNNYQYWTNIGYQYVVVKAFVHITKIQT